MTVLQVPYKSQLAPTAGYSNNDCGPTCIAMMIAATGNDVTVDSLYQHPSIRGQTGLLSISSLQAVAKSYNVPLTFNKLNPDSLRQQIDSGRPVFLLVDYRPIVVANLNCVPTQGWYGHFVLAVGYDAASFIIHDPYCKGNDGAFRHWPNNVFQSCWCDGHLAEGNTYSGQCLVPDNPIAAPQAAVQPPFPVDDGLMRRIQARALYDKVPAPVINNQNDLNAATTWLGDWGQYAQGYFIQASDTLVNVAQAQLGSADYAPALAAYNGIKDPSTLTVGMKILIPLVGKAQQAGVQPTSPPTIPDVPPPVQSVIPLDDGTDRRIRAKAIFESLPVPVINSQNDYNNVMQWLGVWGHLAEGYVITAGDSLSSLADRRFGNPAFAAGIAAYNGLSSIAAVTVGQKILIPLPEPNATPTPAAAPSGAPAAAPAPASMTYAFTNQQVINAFARVYKTHGEAPDNYWIALVKAGLDQIANNRDAQYNGPSIQSLTGVPDQYKTEIRQILGA